MTAVEAIIAIAFAGVLRAGSACIVSPEEVLVIVVGEIQNIAAEAAVYRFRPPMRPSNVPCAAAWRLTVRRVLEVVVRGKHNNIVTKVIATEPRPDGVITAPSEDDVGLIGPAHCLRIVGPVYDGRHWPG